MKTTIQKLSLAVMFSFCAMFFYCGEVLAAAAPCYQAKGSLNGRTTFLCTYRGEICGLYTINKDGSVAEMRGCGAFYAW